jgi:hypothetical protein
MSVLEHRQRHTVRLRQLNKRRATRASVLSLAGIGGFSAEVTSGSSGVALALCAALALLSGLAAAALWSTVLSEMTDFPYRLDLDEDSWGDSRGSATTPLDGAVQVDWSSFERDFREYVSRSG